MVTTFPADAPGCFELLPAHAAHRLYAVSRDLYAPILAAFAARCLDDLRQEPRALNVCLARDGISPFLAQHVLLRLAPERFRGVSARQVRLAYLSRQLVQEGSACQVTRELVDGYLRDQGVRHAAPLTLVDVGIHGSIQDELQRWYPDRTIRGRYLVYRRRPGDANAARKQGFLVGAMGTGDEARFLRREVIHLLEDLWSGVHESVTCLRPVNSPDTGTRVRPALERLGTRTALSVPPRQLWSLKRAALRGTVDGVARVARSRGGVPRGAEARERIAGQARELAAWIASTRDDASPDAWLWRSLIRPQSEASAADHDWDG